jgi:hypothetical protein
MEKTPGYVDVAILDKIKNMTFPDLLALRESIDIVLLDRRESAEKVIAAFNSAGIEMPKAKRAPRSDKGRPRKGIGPAPEMGNVVDMGEIG